MTENFYSWLEENKKHIEERMRKAEQKAGKPENSTTLLAVTKTVPQETIAAAIGLGIKEIGENKVQEMLQKYDGLQHLQHTTHIIGHLQTNKVKYLPSKIQMVQSVDSIKLAKALNAVCAKANKSIDVLVEVNIGGEACKSGIVPECATELCAQIAEEYPCLHLRGLMAIPPVCENDRVRAYFAQMYKLFVDIAAKKLDNVNIDILSMGMSHDFEEAILEGATLVRVGTSLFGHRNYN
ncbi:MAG: YggS family pyridoxal phosphate-dependent enzyme [Oscillospiraceae bacterium]|nr:YggS family pyridoxal phosphate-dependent enzyme [Oscillospiraceae bacterium]